MTDSYFIPVITATVQLLKVAGLPGKFAPVVALVLGFVLSFLTGITLLEKVVSGLVFATAAMGLYEVGKRLPVVNEVLKTK